MTDTALAQRAANQLEARTEKGLTLQDICDMTGYAPAQVALVVHTVAKGATVQELAVFLHACKMLQLDPLLRQAYWIRRKSRVQVNGEWQDEWKGTLQVGIDGFRAIAERSGAYAGSEPPRFMGQVEVNFKTRVGNKEQDATVIAPERAQVVVWKIVQGHKAAFTGEAHWTEFYPGDGATGQMYRKMPRHMLAKDAEAQALRKAFPALLSAVQISPLAEGENPEDLAEIAAPRTVVQERADPERIARNSETYSRIYESEYGDEGTTSAVAEPPAAVEAVPAEAPNSAGAALVTDKNDPLWQEWLKAEKKALKAGFDGDTSNIHLGISESDLQAAIDTLLADVEAG